MFKLLNFIFSLAQHYSLTSTLSADFLLTVIFMKMYHDYDLILFHKEQEVPSKDRILKLICNLLFEIVLCRMLDFLK